MTYSGSGFWSFADKAQAFQVLPSDAFKDATLQRTSEEVMVCQSFGIIYNFEMKTTRQFWVEILVKTAKPVFRHLAEGTLKTNMPVEQHPEAVDRSFFTHLEAAGRSLAGIAPWLNQQDGCELEKKEREAILQLIPQALGNMVESQSPDHIDFSAGPQILVDTAFLAQGFLRAWDRIWLPLDPELKDALIKKTMETRQFKPGQNNWLLFSAMVEAFLCRAGAAWDPVPIEFALKKHLAWYKGDGVYGDGEEYHCDYYNSFVIQPMLYDILSQPGEISNRWGMHLPVILERAKRYAVHQERSIAPEGSFPPFGRSLTYRFGVFQLLGQMALTQNLNADLRPAGVRCAMTAALKKSMTAAGTFDAEGWLQIGLCGHQPALGETYISTGSLYLTLCGFLPLGLPPEDPFWSDPDEDWTAKQIWNGGNLSADKALHA